MKVFFRELVKGRFLGHPLHMMLVHFPAALFPFGFCMDILGRLFNDGVCAGAAFYATAVGTAAGIAAIAAGAIDYFKIPPQDPALNKASLHALMNGTWIFTFGLLTGLRMGQYPVFKPAEIWMLIISGLINLGMLVSNYLGGDLVVKHHVGIHEAVKKTVGKKDPIQSALHSRN